MKAIGIGTDDFKEIRENDYLFIDKTLLIRELIDDGSKALLFPRPRRFGKSLNMSMLDYYFNLEYKDISKDLFNGLNISKCSDRYLNEMNKYPVVSLSLKECKKDSYNDFIDNFKTIISKLYSKYTYLLDSPLIKEIDKEYFRNCLDKKQEIELARCISNLIDMLSIYHKEQVIVLLDEYDTPIMESYLKGFYKEVINFMKDLFTNTFKGNLNLKKGIITGILRVSKEGMFSEANNIKVYSVCDYKYSTYFGFLEGEVKDSLKDYNLSGKYEDVKKWYDGYLFGESKIYNPWSILNFLSDPKNSFRTYWVNTGGVDLLKDLIYRINDNSILLSEYHKLLETGIITNIDLDLYMDLNTLKGNDNTVWTLFMLSGYLTPIEYNDSTNNITLKIPNLEIKENLEKICLKWFTTEIFENYNFSNLLLRNSIEKFKSDFKDVVLKSFSYYDVPNNDSGENFYHAFVMELLYSGNRNFYITSNRESGFGRYDLLLKPKNNSCNHAYIIEFKAIEENDFEKTLEKAFIQIEDKNYAASLSEYDVTKIVIVFKGKDIRIETRK
ncbi:MAG: AAA family ATPase [Bacilli bacterium]|nr:AAA family ATPase [Bacilli bacterium]